MDTVTPFRRKNSETLKLSQQTASFLRKHTSAGLSAIPIPFVDSTESVELWATYEANFLSCLRAGNDQAAHLSLERLISRFGAKNEKVMGLRGLYQEAVAKDDAGLTKVLKEYDDILTENSVNVPILKRQVALLRHFSRTSEAIDALIELLDFSPTDIEAWAELSDLDFSQCLYSQAIFCLAEVLVTAPNAWNIHAWLRDILYISSMNDTVVVDWHALAEALKRFCRSIELCDDYLRGYYGLKTVIDSYSASSANDDSKKLISLKDAEASLPDVETVHLLN